MSDKAKRFSRVDGILKGGSSLLGALDLFSSDQGQSKTSMAKAPDLGSLEQSGSIASSEPVFKDLIGREHATEEAATSASAVQYTGFSALSTGLQTLGSMQNTRAQEEMELENIKNQFNFQAEEIENNAMIQNMARRRVRSKNILARANALARQATNSQRQQFFRDPETGAPL